MGLCSSKIAADPDARSNSFLAVVREDIIGALKPYASPFGTMPTVYADWVASGRAVYQIEAFISENVLPAYGNTHTLSSFCGASMTNAREEARSKIAKMTNSRGDDVVLFAGDGATGAFTKLLLSLKASEQPDVSTVIISSKYEHHSNILLWYEADYKIISVDFDPVTGVSLSQLNNILKQHEGKEWRKIGCFSACSNVTGFLTDVDAVAVAIHKAGGLVCFDYSAAAPYVKMDMNPIIEGDDGPYAYKDAIMFSGHKFLGAPSTPGILIAKRHLLPSGDHPPTVQGGGTVVFVTSESIHYTSDINEREEAGTPSIIGAIRLGLAFSMKEQMGYNWMKQQLNRISKYAERRLKEEAGDAIVLLGRPKALPSDHIPHNFLPTFSFLVKSGSKFLHHNFVTALLNDLFGVQTRSGCSCAGLWGEYLLGTIDDVNASGLVKSITEDGDMSMKPGWTRFSLAAWLTQDEIDYVLDSVLFVALNGRSLMSLYTCNDVTGQWVHKDRDGMPSQSLIGRFQIREVESKRAPTRSKCLTLQQKTLMDHWGGASARELFSDLKINALDILSNLPPETGELSQVIPSVEPTQNTLKGEWSRSKVRSKVIEKQGITTVELLAHTKGNKWFRSSKGRTP